VKTGTELRTVLGGGISALDFLHLLPFFDYSAVKISVNDGDGLL
jgi:hypothetical protein